MMKRKALSVCGAAVLTFGLTGCTVGFEGTGTKHAASAEQLALRTDDPWAKTIEIDPAKKASGTLVDGVYVGVGVGMDGLITTTLLVQDNRITCIEIAQEGESQGVGGYEAIRDGKFATMIDAAQGADFDVLSGATITTNGVKEAVEDALAQAALGKQSPESIALAARAGATVSESTDAGTTATNEKE